MNNYLLFYTDKYVPEPFAGKQRWFCIFIRPQYCADRGLLEHEKVHVSQWWRFWKRLTKLEREVEAYREQAKWYDSDKIPMFAMFIATRYGLNITAVDAEKLLRA